jgi:hypothetical protein
MPAPQSRILSLELRNIPQQEQTVPCHGRILFVGGFGGLDDKISKVLGQARLLSAVAGTRSA